MNLRTFTVISIFVFSNLCSGQSLFFQKISELQNDSLMKGAGIGIMVLNPENDSVLFDLNSNTSFVPASILKIVTSAAALEILGSDYIFKTKLATTGAINKETGELPGGLIIIGGGDPTLGSEYFPEQGLNPHFLDRWVEEVKLKGIRKIDGDILADISVYDEIIIPDSWTWGDIGNYYGAGAGGISVYDNSIRILFRSGEIPGNPVDLTGLSPLPEKFEIQNYVLSSDDPSDNAYVYGPPWAGRREIRGTIPGNRVEFKIKASMPEPAMVLGNQIRKKLGEAGIPVSGGVKIGKAGPETVVLYECLSPPLSEIIEVLNHKSVNLFAEHLAKQIALEKTGIGSTSVGLEIISEFWKNKGIDTRGMFLEDGSGLSRSDVISPRQVAEVLSYMKTKSPESQVFENSLPNAGEGTLSTFNPENFPDFSLRCKSGSMARVRSYAGYVKTLSGQDLVFVFMVNNFSMSQKELVSRLEDLLVLIREEK